jgi:ubiquinone biosynthesis protein
LFRPGAFVRLAHAAWVLAREGVLRAMAPPDPPALGRLVLAVSRLIERGGIAGVARSARVSEALNQLGPSYVKLGQFLATRPDVVGRDMARDLEALQDRLTAFPRAEAIAAIERALGRPVTELFVDIGEPMAAASIAQVHRAKVLDDDGSIRDVAVKVLRRAALPPRSRQFLPRRAHDRMAGAIDPTVASAGRGRNAGAFGAAGNGSQAGSGCTFRDGREYT